MTVKIGVAVALVGLATLFTVVHLRTEWLLRSRLLMSTPNAIIDDAQLRAYALRIGRPVYQGRCLVCHGPELQGDARRGIPNLADRDWLYGTGRVGEIERVVLYGIRAGHSKTLNAASMPAFATPNPYLRYKIEPLRPDELDDVAGLIYSFQHPGSVAADTVRRGLAVYRGKGLCFDCHSDHANGDPAIGAPNLVDAIWLHGDGSLDSIRESIARGQGGVCPPWIGRLDPGQIRSVAVFVNTFNATRK